MKATDLYLSMLQNAKLTFYVRQEQWENLMEITETEFKITNKQGFFMRKLMNEKPASDCDRHVIEQSGKHNVCLIPPPHYIKFNGFFTIKRTDIKIIK